MEYPKEKKLRTIFSHEKYRFTIGDGVGYGDD